jgi:Flp pilus assembly protein TadD
MRNRKGTFEAVPVLLGLALALGLAGCETTAEGPQPMAQAAPQPAPPPTASMTEPPTTPTIQEPGTVKYFPSDEPLRLAVENFNRGNYGLAERYFRDAVERTPRDVTAWVGLAASYDRLARFDLADRAYRYAIKLGGTTPQILNNQGYSYMLRGNYVRARQLLTKAAQLEPNNPVIANNLQLLDGSRQFVKRADN